ncbi:helix-turn-helix domain-containing protein [Ligilactobacillus animalis]|uniref:HTH cro/C1-type domain-containing protein n=1 Tax=Ligilactobacillus animalis TaxID=1605 RepID=A0ABR4RNH3_9LACO|nr:helix-turn-helix transcriptional regulator [Ligilactobacillus animalis]KDA45665.1 hypothetical protein Lani381_1290 [Ligilactobacillus animalis]MEE0261224.1 helix-turn-helix transcriptional regulator [Ligilactobacillus animalis]
MNQGSKCDIISTMTIRKEENRNKDVGQVLQKYRLRLTDIPKSRQAFIDDRSRKFFDNTEWISEKTLGNYETGKNIPTLLNLKKLSMALEVDIEELLTEIVRLL